MKNRSFRYNTALFTYRSLGRRCWGEKLKKLRAERKMAELQLAKATNKALDADAVIRSWQNVVLIARQKFLGLESKLSSQLGFTDFQQAELRREIEEALTELSRPQQYGVTED